MDPSRQLTDQGQLRRRQLLDAAESSFSTKGYAATRIADICNAAGVAKGLFYWYFDTKESLFAELVRERRTALRRDQAAAMDPLDDPVTRIRDGAVASVRFMAKHRSYFALLETERLDPIAADVLQESARIYVGDVERLVLEAQRVGQIPDDAETQLLALGVLSAVSQFSQYHRSGRVTVGLDQLAEFVGDWVVGALEGRFGGTIVTPSGRSTGGRSAP